MSDYPIILRPAKAHKATVIWLHGLGADGNDFVQIIPELKVQSLEHIKFVFPHAPIRPITVNGGAPMRGWYDISSMEIARTPDIAGIEQSVRTLNSMIQAEEDAGLDASRIILAGFSQGGVIALETAMAHDKTLGGVLALSTYLPDVERIQSTQTPVFMAHGVVDDVIPLDLAQRSARAMRSADMNVEFESYPMAHQVCMEELDDLSKRLNQWLKHSDEN